MSYIRLTRDFYQAVEALMEGKVEEKLDPQASEGGGSHPKTDRHQKLAAMGHPKDKITHKDVLIARGVVAKEDTEIEEGKETEQMMVKSFKPEVVDTLNKQRGVTKHPPYRNPRLEKLAAQKKAMKEDAEEQFDELQENISNKHRVGDVYQPHLVDHIKNKTGTKVYFDGDDMVHEKTGKTIMNVKAHHTVGDAISAVKNLKEDAEEQFDELQENISNKHRVGDVYQPHLVDHIKNKTGTKVYFDGDDMVHEKTGKTIMNVKAHHTVGDAISAVKNLKEDAEELDEVIRNDPLLMKVGPIRSRDNTTGRSSPEEQQQGKEKVKQAVKTSIDRMKTDRKPRLPEEVEEQVDQIITENNSFEIEVPARLTYKDYLDAAMQFVDAEDALTVAEAFYNEQDESLVIESFVRSDIEQKVAVHQKAGNQVSMPKFGTKDGKPYAEYVVTNKDDGIRRKYIHHGTMRRVENMGARGKKDAD